MWNNSPDRLGSPQPCQMLSVSTEAPNSDGPIKRTRDVAPSLPTKRPSARAIDFPRPPGHEDYYQEIPTGFCVVRGNNQHEAKIYQPTPDGLAVLIDFFQKETASDLRLFRQEHVHLNSLENRFADFKKNFNFSSIKPGCFTGVILSMGQNHAIPIVVSFIENKKSLFIFDSTSGGSQKSYCAVANLFADYDVYLNRGTRQADSQSCITDAVEVLRIAADMPDLAEQIKLKSVPIDMTIRRTNSRLILAQPILNQQNFYIFGMPAKLCITAQCSKFIEDAHVNPEEKFLLNNETTSLSRENLKFKEIILRPIKIPADDYSLQPAKASPINSYLYEASFMHKEIIDRHLANSLPEAERVSNGALNFPV
jgi:hypothetical protein